MVWLPDGETNSNIRLFVLTWSTNVKNRRFHVPQPTFLFPLETPLRLSRNMLHGWKDNSMLANPPPLSMYLSIFNSFRVIRCLSQCLSPKIAIFTTFLFPLGTPLGQSGKMSYGWKENSMLTNCLWDRARYLWKKSSFYHTPCIRRPR